MTACRKDDFFGEIIGNPCPDCGHTNLVHPGDHNPAIVECLLCVVLAAKTEEEQP